MAWFTQGSEEYGEHGELLLQFFLDDEENDDRVVVRISELVRCLKHFRESVLSNDKHDYEYEMAGNLWAAPLGSGTLTAEQVRKAVEGHGNIMDNRLYEDWEAVADKLNAELGGGTCEWVLEHSGTLYDKWRCSKCGYLFVESRTDQGIKEDFEPNFCPDCGKKVER